MTGYEGDAAKFAPLVAAELADPAGTKVLVVEVGDLSDPATVDALRRGLESLAGKAPPVGP